MKGYLKLYLPAIVSGIALVFSFPRFDLYSLAWFCIAPFIASLFGMNLREAFRAGIVFGIFYFLGTQYWIYHSIHHYGGVSLIPSLLLVVLLSLYMSLYTGVFALIFSYKIKGSRLPAMLLAPIIWVSLEFARSYALTGFPWSSIGYSQWRFLSIIQFADITGIYGVSFLLIAINGAIADIFIMRWKKKQMPLFSILPTMIGMGLLLIILLVAFAYSNKRLNENRVGSAFRASLIQGNIPQDIKWSPEYQSQVIDIYKSLTLSVVPEKPSLIIWPESALPFYFGRDKALTSEFLRFQQSLNTYLLVGTVTEKGVSELANSAIMLNDKGALIYSYDKIHLVPFGEYIPLRGILFFLNKLVTGIGDFIPGEKHLIAKTPFGGFGTLICYEIIFPGLVRKFYQKGGDFIVTITNDGWFGRTNGPYQHFSMAVFRAIENRKPVLRSANTGISGFIDSSGRIIKTTNLLRRTTITAQLKGDKTLTFYTRFGDLFSYLTIVLLVLILIDFRKEE